MTTGVRAGEGERLCLPLAAWPAHDRACWAAATCPGDLLLDGGPAAQLRPGSLRKCIAAYGRWLGWLAEVGQLDPNVAPAARVTRQQINAYVTTLQEINAPLTVLGRIADLATVLRWFAPEQDWSWLRAMQARLRGRVGTAPQDRKRARLRSGHELLALGLQLMDSASSATGLSQRRRARLYRDGLMIALLAARPLRLANLVQLALGRELVRRGEGWWIEIEGSDTKTGAPLELPWPQDLVPALEIYLRVWRPLLAPPRCSAGCGALWLSNQGRGVSDAQAYSKIVAHTRAAFGQPVNPHLFRDTAATTLARERPAQVRLAAPLLGHRSYTTTERYYNLAQGNEAAGAWHDVLEKIAEDR